MKRLHLYMTLFFLAGSVVSIYAACVTQNGCQNNGSLSETFGIDGKVITDFKHSNDIVRGLAILPDNKIIAVGGSDACHKGRSDFALACYTSYGALNDCFGHHGKLLTSFADMVCHTEPDFCSCDYAFGCALYPCLSKKPVCMVHCVESKKADEQHCCDQSVQDTLVVVGTSNATRSGCYAFALARYTLDGKLDKSFNRTGKLITRIGIHAQAHAVAVAHDGKIVVAGYAIMKNRKKNFVVVRYNGDGSLDRTFGGKGKGIVVTHFTDHNAVANAVKIQQDGKIVVAGYSSVSGCERHVALCRYTCHGELDRTFGKKHTGKIITCCGGTDEAANALVIQNRSDCHGALWEGDKIVVVGYSNNNRCKRYSFTLICYDENGCIDKQFGLQGTGIVSTCFSRKSNDIALAAELLYDCAGQCGLIVVGMSTHKWLPSMHNCGLADFALARYTMNGCLDTCFGIDGKVLTHFGEKSEDKAYAVGIQSNGKLIVGGVSNLYGTKDFALARYNMREICCLP